MLVLGRRPGEGIMIGDNIKVSVVKIDGEMKLTVDAPKDVKIMRCEVYERAAEKQAISKFMNG